MDSITPAERQFIQTLCYVVESDGLPRITGQILGLLILADEPLSGSRMAELLHVSRASVSTSVRFLMSVALVERRSTPGERQAVYCLCADPFGSYAGELARRAATNSRRILRSADSVENPRAAERIRDLADFFATMAAAIATVGGSPTEPALRA